MCVALIQTDVTLSIGGLREMGHVFGLRGLPIFFQSRERTKKK